MGRKPTGKSNVQGAIKTGRLKKLPCEVCGEPIVEAHHDDYDKPLDVKWLCKKHHHELHKAYRRSGIKIKGYRARRFVIRFDKADERLLRWLLSESARSFRSFPNQLLFLLRESWKNDLAAMQGREAQKT